MDNIFSKSDEYLIKTYKRFEVYFEKGEGVFLFTPEGDKFLDLLAGIAVNSLGHSHPVVVDSIKRQAEKLIHVSNLYHIKQQTELAEILINQSCCDKAFFVNSGAEANEAALKLARIYGNPKRNRILSFKDSFHGRTLGSLALTGQTKYHKGFEPMPEGFDYVEFNNFDDFLKKVDNSVVAIFVEFVQGEGGINPIDKQFVRKVYDYCKKHDILFIADEVQTGIGRTGKLFAYQHYDVEPDIITLAKGLGGGFPIGCMIAKDFVAEKFTYGTHGCTFGGNPLACAVSRSVVEYIIENNLSSYAGKMGDYLLEELNKIFSNNEDVEKIKGFGLMIGIEFKDPKKADEFVKKAFESRILVGKAGDSTVRIEPPLIIKKEELDLFLQFCKEYQ